jgi:hypothetical protein
VESKSLLGLSLVTARLNSTTIKPSLADITAKVNQFATNCQAEASSFHHSGIGRFPICGGVSGVFVRHAF